MSIVKETYNVLPRITFRWVKANQLELDALEVDATQGYAYEEIDTEMPVKRLTNEDLPLSESFIGVNEKMVKLADRNSNAGLYIELAENETGKMHISHRLAEGNGTLIEKNVIVLNKGSRLDLVMDYSSDESVTFSNILNKVRIEEGAELNIVKIQRLNAQSRHLESRYTTIAEKGRVNYISVEIGGREALVNYMTDLNGDESEGHVKNVYLGFGERILDLSHHMNHIGKKTVSDMIFKGAMKDQAKKVFRGTLDFKKGSTHSTGNEEEFVVLLSPKVKSYAVPLLLCREDDVIGNHAASAGQIDADKLFYIMSRGFSEDEAKRIIVESYIRPVIDLIPVEKIRDLVIHAVDREIKGE